MGWAQNALLSAPAIHGRQHDPPAHALTIGQAHHPASFCSFGRNSHTSQRRESTQAWIALFSPSFHRGALRRYLAAKVMSRWRRGPSCSTNFTLQHLRWQPPWTQGLPRLHIHARGLTRTDHLLPGPRGRSDRYWTQDLCSSLPKAKTLRLVRRQGVSPGGSSPTTSNFELMADFATAKITANGQDRLVILGCRRGPRRWPAYPDRDLCSTKPQAGTSSSLQGKVSRKYRPRCLRITAAWLLAAGRSDHRGSSREAATRTGAGGGYYNLRRVLAAVHGRMCCAAQWAASREPGRR